MDSFYNYLIYFWVILNISELTSNENKPKALNVTLLRTSQDYSTPIGISVSVILFSCVLFFIMWSVAWQCLQHSNKEMILRLEELNLTPNNNSSVSLQGDKSFNGEPPASSTPLLTIENTPMTPINLVRRNLCIKIEETEKSKSKFIVNRLLVDKMFVSETCQVRRGLMEFLGMEMFTTPQTKLG